ncbi:transposase [Candidatus Electronema sp. JM]
MKARHFQSAEQLAAYLGRAPLEDRSGQTSGCAAHGRCCGRSA